MPIFASVFIALNEAGVPFLVIRGHAVVLHGHEPNLEDPELQAIISKYGGPGALNEIQRRVICS